MANMAALTIVTCALLAININLVEGEFCETKLCEYKWDVRWAMSMTYTTPDKDKNFDVALNGSQLQITPSLYHPAGSDALLGTTVDPSQVITADGFRKKIITVNGQFPGPTIEVMEGAEVAVEVTSSLPMTGFTIHWHGIHQKMTPWSDGVPYLTQCPILPHQTFTYRFLAYPAGTHWWHSHLENQRLDGFYGFIIVYKMKPLLPSFTMSIGDWFHVDGESMMIENPLHHGHPGTGGDIWTHVGNRDFSLDGIQHTMLSIRSGLIEGRGRYDDRPFPLKQYNVSPGSKYRFHVANVGADLSYILSIDKHKLRVVAVDGYSIEPILADEVFVHAGETLELELDADQTVSKYWVRARTPRAGRGPNITHDGIVKENRAVLVYDGTLVKGDPLSSPAVCSFSDMCVAFNCFFKDYPPQEYKRCININQARSSQPAATKDIFSSGESPEDVEEIFLNFGFSGGFPGVNGIGFVAPNAPLYQTDNGVLPCSEECLQDGFCFCTQTVDLALNKTYQIVLTNYDAVSKMSVVMTHHPMHLHGNSFAIVKMGFANYDILTGKMISPNPDIECLNPSCSRLQWINKPSDAELNLENPPIKDNVIIPAMGYVVVRLRATNPGHWLFHCHMDSHAVDGMIILFTEGKDFIPDIPNNFPTCEQFKWSQKQFDEYLAENPLKNIGKNDETDVTLTTTTTQAPAPNPTAQPCKNDNDDDDGNSNNNNDILMIGPDSVTVKFSILVGMILGSVGVGAVLVLLPVIIYACVVTKKQSRPNVNSSSMRMYSSRTLDIDGPSSSEYKM